MAAGIGAGTVIGGLLWLGGSVIVNGVVAGSLIASAFGIIVYKLGKSENRVLGALYRTAVRYPLATDVGVTAAAFMMAPAGITAWISASIAGLLASVWLFAAKPAEDEDQEPSFLEQLEVKIRALFGPKKEEEPAEASA